MICIGKDKNKKIYIREVGPREGAQSYTQIIPTNHKLELIRLLCEANLPEIEITAMVRADRVPNMTDSDDLIEELKKLYPQNCKTKFSALYLNDKGFLRALNHNNLINEGWVSLSASESFLINNNNSNFSKLINSTPLLLELFKSNQKALKGLMVSNSFGCNLQGDITPKEVIDAINPIYDLCLQVKLLPEYIMLADTTGDANPYTLQKLIEAIRDKFGQSKIALHLHDTKGLGMANALVGLEMGVDFFDSSVAGVGGCPFVAGASGNIATEELVYLCQSVGLETNINFDKLKEAVKYAKQIFSSAYSSKLAKTFF